MEQQIEKMGAEMAANRKTGVEKIVGIEAILVRIQEHLKILIVNKASSSKLKQQKSKSKSVINQNKTENDQFNNIVR